MKYLLLLLPFVLFFVISITPLSVIRWYHWLAEETLSKVDRTGAAMFGVFLGFATFIISFFGILAYILR